MGHLLRAEHELSLVHTGDYGDHIVASVDEALRHELIRSRTVSEEILYRITRGKLYQQGAIWLIAGTPLGIGCQQVPSSGIAQHTMCLRLLMHVPLTVWQLGDFLHAVCFYRFGDSAQILRTNAAHNYHSIIIMMMIIISRKMFMMLSS